MQHDPQRQARLQQGVWKRARPCSTKHHACRRPAPQDAGWGWLAAPCHSAAVYSAAASRSGTRIFGKDGVFRETRNATLMPISLCVESSTDLEHGSPDEAPRAFEAVSCHECFTRFLTSRRTGWHRIPALCSQQAGWERSFTDCASQRTHGAVKPTLQSPTLASMHNGIGLESRFAASTWRFPHLHSSRQTGE